MIYKYYPCSPRWINFENQNGQKGSGGVANNGAKGHAFEHLEAGVQKNLCDFQGEGIVRKIWMTLNRRTPDVLQNVILKMYWDYAKIPQVEVPLGDFFCMGLGKMAPFENALFSTAEGRSFSCFIPMPFRKHCKIVLENNTETRLQLFYDIDLTLQKVADDDMYFFAEFQDIPQNELEKDVEILPRVHGTGRFLGANIAVIPNRDWYGDLWWGEGEAKIFIDGDTDRPTLVGTGAEDYIGSAWELGEFTNQSQGCVTRDGDAISMYRFHLCDPIFFESDIKVTLQAMGGGKAEKVEEVMKKGFPCVPVSFYNNSNLHCIYKSDYQGEMPGYINFFRCDHYRVVAYYYQK